MLVSQFYHLFAMLLRLVQKIKQTIQTPVSIACFTPKNNLKNLFYATILTRFFTPFGRPDLPALTLAALAIRAISRRRCAGNALALAGPPSLAICETVIMVAIC